MSHIISILNIDINLLVLGAKFLLAALTTLALMIATGL
jgi:hypothetical protein